MARRAHLTEVGFVACDDLGELGAGRKEGWLADDSVLAALHSGHLAVANHSLVVVLSWGDASSGAYGDIAGPPVKIRPSLSPAEGEIAALEWLAIEDFLALAVGTTGGYLLLYSISFQPELVHKQIVHSARILKLRFREIEDDSDPDTLSQELCVVMPGVIARFDGSDIKRLLQGWLEDRHSNGWNYASQKKEGSEGDSNSRISYQLWNVSKYGSCSDAAITGIMPPPLLELQSQQRHYCAVTVGNDAVISAFRISEDRSRSLVGAILSKVVPAAFSTISSFSKMIWRSDQSSSKKPETATQPFAKASPLTCLKDQPRKGEKLILSPSGSLAAITDSLGRILLLDTRALVVVRLWKGYRDACCLFVEMLVKKDKGKSTSPDYYSEYTKADYCLCLAIHAPRKGIIEVWKMRTGPRVFTIQCPKGSIILQPSSRFGSSSTTSYIPLEVFVLNGDSGQLSMLNRSIS